jgi:hypothetical protein
MKRLLLLLCVLSFLSFGNCVNLPTQLSPAGVTGGNLPIHLAKKQYTAGASQTSTSNSQISPASLTSGREHPQIHHATGASLTSTSNSQISPAIRISGREHHPKKPSTGSHMSASHSQISPPGLTSGREHPQIHHPKKQSTGPTHTTVTLPDYNRTAEVIESTREDNELLLKIPLMQNPQNETRVISFALYGTLPKYNVGAIRNAELAKIYFPGWTCRFYTASDVLQTTTDRLKELGSEIETIPPGMGAMSGMLWRFLVASDAKVDRYIIRDADSRVNARDR